MVVIWQRAKKTKVSYYFVLALALLPCWSNGFPSTKHVYRRNMPRQQQSIDYYFSAPNQSRCVVFLNEDVNDEHEDTESGTNDKKPITDQSTSYTWEELQSDPELSRIELESSIRRKNAMLLPQRISQAVSTLAWGFVIVGILLNQLGYAYIRDPSGGIGVGTLK
ncbi:hypothetical protein HJC23_002161 [Cyclotella cryptica]|uniref:Uncharacterized protein n=1 Tax=Cyclotella cryptica TaxID=29204 RepID=A0ABD3Q6A9_9STRA